MILLMILLILLREPGITRIHRNASIKRHRERAPKRTPKEWGEGPQAPKRPKIIKIRKQTRNHPESSNSIDKAITRRVPKSLFLDPSESKNYSFKLFWGSDLIVKMRLFHQNVTNFDIHILKYVKNSTLFSIMPRPIF